MTKHFCDRCGKECAICAPIIIPLRRTVGGGYDTKPVDLCAECEREYDTLIDKLLDIRMVMFRDFVKGGVQE